MTSTGQPTDVHLLAGNEAGAGCWPAELQRAVDHRSVRKSKSDLQLHAQPGPCGPVAAGPAREIHGSQGRGGWVRLRSKQLKTERAGYRIFQAGGICSPMGRSTMTRIF